MELQPGQTENLHRRWKRDRIQDRPPSLSASYRRYLEEVGAFLILPSSTTDALLPMYNTLIDDLVPIVDGLRLLRAHSNGKASTYLLRAVCLISAKANQAGPFLRLVENEEVLTCSRFTECLRIGLEAAMHAGLERDRIVRIQVLALLHLHNDGSGGPARASKSLAAAISEAWAIPIHFPVSDDPNAEQYAMLWWSLRNLDRLNKPVMGCAPFMIDDTDIRLDRVALRVGDYRSELMVVSTRLGDLMAHATKAYKASYRGTADVEGPWPPFSDITADVRLDLMHQAHRGLWSPNPHFENNPFTDELVTQRVPRNLVPRGRHAFLPLRRPQHRAVRAPHQLRRPRDRLARRQALRAASPVTSRPVRHDARHDEHLSRFPRRPPRCRVHGARPRDL